MNDIDRARLELRDHMKHLFRVILDSLPGDLDKEEKQAQAECVFDNIIDSEIVMVENFLA